MFDDKVVPLWSAQIARVENHVKNSAVTMALQRERLSQLISVLSLGLSGIEREASAGLAAEARDALRRPDLARAQVDDVSCSLKHLNHQAAVASEPAEAHAGDAVAESSTRNEGARQWTGRVSLAVRAWKIAAQCLPMRDQSLA
jgi:hypothetical protein